MSIEVAVLILRLLAGLSLLAFLIILFAIVWRSMRQLDRQLQASRVKYGYLICRRLDSSEMAAESYELSAITTLGRSASNSIIVNDDFASAEHARIVLEDGQWWLEDRRSKNGTRLNDAAIDQRTILANGDLIGIGELTYQLTLEAQIDASAN
ncbi:MAG: FHA domain-containing protein [Chloroflexi bacterium]|nr:FHA domain-containing protein [Chloroflexota bacterium]